MFWIIFRVIGKISFALLLPITNAQTLDSQFALKLRQARTKDEIDHIKSRYEHLKIAKLACRRQLIARALPSACYEALFLEKKWNTISRPTEDLALQQRLDELCRQATRAFRLPEGEAVGATFLSSTCTRELTEARKILAYKAKDRMPWHVN